MKYEISSGMILNSYKPVIVKLYTPPNPWNVILCTQEECRDHIQTSSSSS
jgi:hypothetical protein